MGCQQLTYQKNNFLQVAYRKNEQPQKKNVLDYFSGGMAMPNRNIVGDYRYNYQGQELDQETGKVAFELRLYDPRINRWMSPDPKGQYFSPYMSMGNNWTRMVDPDGGAACPDPPCNDPSIYPNTAGTQELAEVDLGTVMRKGSYGADAVPVEISFQDVWAGSRASYQIKFPEFAGMGYEQMINQWNKNYRKYYDDPTLEYNGRSQIDGYDYNKAIQTLNSNCKNSSTGKCAKYVRFALEGGGLDLSNRPASTASAKGYTDYLPTLGFTEVSQDNYVPMAGDIVVMQSFTGKRVHKHGHIQMYNGSKWISDFKQRDFWPGSDYRNNTPAYSIFR